MTAVAPLTERLAVQDATIVRQAETIERQAGEIAELREDRGRLTAENEVLRAARAQQEAQQEPPQATPVVTPEATTGRWQALAPWLLMVLAIPLAVIAAGVIWVALTMPRW
jgi:hypothetical protein